MADATMGADMRSHRSYQSRYSRSRYDDPPPFLVRAGAILAVAGAVLLFAGPVAYRFGLLSLPVASGRVFTWGAYLGGIAALVSIGGLIAALRRREGRRGTGRAVLAILVGAVALRAGGRLPFVTPAVPLTDVTTDTANPPVYVAVADVRGADASTSLSYPGEPLAARQREAYPDIAPLVLPSPKEEVFARALRAVRDMGWTLVAADGAAGRIEASARTTLFGTTDDVVVRVIEAEGGSRVDVRSVAREPDSRTPADRVRALLSALRAS